MTTCAECGQSFTPERTDAVYCSSACRQRAYRKRNKKPVTDTEADFERRVQAEVTKRLTAERRRLQDEIQRKQARTTNGLTKAQFDLIRSCLHPDSRASASDEKLAKAFRTFNEADIPTRAELKMAPPTQWNRKSPRR